MHSKQSVIKYLIVDENLCETRNEFFLYCGRVPSKENVRTDWTCVQASISSHLAKKKTKNQIKIVNKTRGKLFYSRMPQKSRQSDAIKNRK